MIISFYDKDFRGLQNNASLVADNATYKLVRRGVDFDDMSCTCEAFTEDMQPTFVVVKNDRGNYIYGALAGIPQRTAENKTKVNSSDLKNMLSSDVLIKIGQYANVNAFLSFVFAEWQTQVNQKMLAVEFRYTEQAENILFSNYIPVEGLAKHNAWDLIKSYLKYYDLYMDSQLNLKEKKVIFTIGKTMLKNYNIRLWELGIEGYGKWVANLNETQGVVASNGEVVKSGYRWILTSDNKITTDTARRDIYPIKRKIILEETDDSTKVTELLNKVNNEALMELCDSLYSENIDVEAPTISPGSDAKFSIFLNRGDKEPFKELPCGELHYDSAGLTKIRIGYRFTGLEFIN